LAVGEVTSQFEDGSSERGAVAHRYRAATIVPCEQTRDLPIAIVTSIRLCKARLVFDQAQARKPVFFGYLFS
jgi:hypothetical protein